MNDQSIGNPLKWSRRDVFIVVGLGLLFGVIYALAFVPLSIWLYAATGYNRPLESLINGIWLLGGFIPMAIVRKPGALLIGESIAAFIEVCIQACPLCAGMSFIDEIWHAGDTYRVLNPIVVSGIMQGVGGELVFSLTGYKKWDLNTWLLAGLGAGLFSWMSGIYVTRSYLPYDPDVRIAILITSTLGMVVLAGAGSWCIQRLIHRDK